jgi:hypothetical protein
MAKCKDCRFMGKVFFNHYGEMQEHFEIAECHYNPPSTFITPAVFQKSHFIGFDTSGVVGGELMHIFPTVKKESFCGKHEPIKATD